MLLVVAAVVLGLLCALLLLPRNQKSSKIKPTGSGAKTKKEWKVYSRAEVSLHKKRDDCWIILKGKVYDVSPYVEEHPGGDAILTHAGDDSTEGFFGPQHGTGAFQLVEDFCIGDLEL